MCGEYNKLIYVVYCEKDCNSDGDDKKFIDIINSYLEENSTPKEIIENINKVYKEMFNRNLSNSEIDKIKLNYMEHWS